MPASSLPPEFLSRLELICGATYFRDVGKTFQKRPTTFRVNTLTNDPQQVLETLSQKKLKVHRVSWNKTAFILDGDNERALQKTDLYEQGAIYLQSLASMVPPLVLDPQPGEVVLDLTAAPGSKTSQIAAMMKRTGSLTAVEKDKIRFERLAHNMKLLKVSDDDGAFISLVNGDGATFCGESTILFDKILLDAPCSAETRFIEGDRRTFGYWDKRAVKDMAYKQRRLLLSAWQRLKPGGVLVYSTCTFAPEENELQLIKLLEKFPNECVVEPISIAGLRPLPSLQQWEGVAIPPPCQKGLRIFPTKEIEGFYVAKVRKAV